MSNTPQNDPACSRSGDQSDLSAHTLPSSTTPRITELLAVGPSTSMCSALHQIVHDFRDAHQIDAERNPAGQAATIARYPISKAPASEVDAIRTISSPTEYAELRHGGRVKSPYPPLSPSKLEEVCKEIAAALVWRSLHPVRRFFTHDS